jgi:hypothetical protein
MVHENNLILFRLRAFLVATLVVAILVLVGVLMSTRTKAMPMADPGFSAGILSSDMSDSPNLITRGFYNLSSIIGSSVTEASDTLGGLLQPIRLPKPHVGNILINFGVTVSHAAGSGVGSVARGVVSSMIFILHLPFTAVGFISHTAVSAMVKPAEHEAVPIIDPHSPELTAAQAALPATAAVQTASLLSTVTPQWPLHGIITTQFGVPEPPYQPIHTGLDISDGHRAGVTAIRPFRPGRVIATIHSRLRLGNEVVVDHGSGVTSVYGHLNSISVQEGQSVDEATVLGFEGTTGVSTGTHLHFEIRVNGQAVDPHKFITGQP